MKGSEKFLHKNRYNINIHTLSGMLGKSSFGGQVNAKSYKTIQCVLQHHLISHSSSDNSEELFSR